MAKKLSVLKAGKLRKLIIFLFSSYYNFAGTETNVEEDIFDLQTKL